MEINWTILAWIAGLIFVYIFGLFEGRGQGYKKRKAEEEQQKREQPALPPATIKVDDLGLLRIKNESGSLALDLDGARVEAASLSSDQRKRLIELLNLLRPWLEGKPVSAPAPTPSASLPPKPVSVPAPQAPLTPQTAAASPAPSTPKPASSSRKDEKNAASTSIVEQINEILQTRIVNTSLATQGVMLLESPTGGVNVYVGINKYEGVDAVPDEEIKTAIRAAISEWENKYTPGL